MKGTDDLQPQQHLRQYWEDDVPLIDVRENALRKFVYVGCVLFGLIIAAGLLIKFPDEVQLEFLLRNDQKEDIYRFPFPVYIEEKFATTGMPIEMGAPLLRITSPEIVLLINDYNTAEKNLLSYMLRNTASAKDQQQILAIKEEQNRRKILEVRQQMQQNDSLWASNQKRLAFQAEETQKRLDLNRQLHESKYISSVELKDSEAEALKASDDHRSSYHLYAKTKTALRDQIDQLALDNSSLTHELDKISLSAASDSTSLAMQLQLATEKIRNIFGSFELSDGSLLLRASDDGVASFIFEGDREVSSGTILLRITKHKSEVYAASQIAPSLIGKLTETQTVYMKVATFPSYEWGTLKGHISSLSTTPNEKGVFNVRVEIDEQRKLQNRLRIGMVGQMTVQLGERSFFSYVFRGIRKTYQEAVE